ncbi:hypothetical protein [Sphingomonas antarctica]|uniref:hypothetical protein n=1 Tax=Sphingomonas antarctica TaxID=2040274 RepID=UPI0039E9D89A
MMAAMMMLAGAIPVAGAQSMDPDLKVRCVREDVIGSLTQKRRVCHTVREWNDIQGRATDEMHRIIQPGTLNGLNN